MKQQIVLICEQNQQIAIAVEEISIQSTVKRIVEDLSDSKKSFINMNDYAVMKDPNKALYIRSSIVKTITTAEINNIQVPNKKSLLVPSGVN